MDVTRFLASQRASQSINPQRTVLLLEPGDEGPVLPGSFDREETGADKTAVLEQPPRTAKDNSTAAPAGTRERFKLRKVVGRGGFGEVWSATQTALSRTVAVKVLNQRTYGDGASSAPAVGLFRAEALIAARLDHPNIVPVYDYQVNERGQPMLAMKFVHGEQWDLAIERDRSRPQGEFLARHLNFLIQVGNAVAFAHSRGIIHRDLKPSQVMLGKFGECLLMDWGLAIVLDTVDDDLPVHHRGTQGEVPSLATATNPAGTPAYLAPEQTKASARDLGTWTDVYLLGGMLYYLLSGETPHSGESAQSAFEHAKAGRIVPLVETTQGRHAPKELIELAEHALHPDPAARVPSAAEFVRRLQAFLAGEGKRAESETLVVAARELLSGKPDYAPLAEVLGLLARAEAMWPENPAVASLRERTLEVYAALATERGDLALARVQAQALRSEPTRRSAMEAVEREERRRRVQRQRLQLSALVIVVLLVSIGVGTALFVSRLSAASKELAVQRDGALTAKREAERSRAEAEKRSAESQQARLETVRALTASNLARAQVLIDEDQVGEAKEILSRIPREARNWEWEYLVSRLPRGLITIPVVADSLSPTGLRIASLDDSRRRVLVHETLAGGRLANLSLPGGETVRSTRWGYPNGPLIVESDAGTVRVYDGTSWRLQHEHRTSGTLASATGFADAWTALGWSDGRLEIVRPGADPVVISGFRSAVTFLETTHDGKALLAHDGSRMKLLRMPEGSVVRNELKLAGIESASISGTGKWLVVSSAGVVDLLNLQDGSRRELQNINQVQFARRADFIVGRTNGVHTPVRYEVSRGTEVFMSGVSVSNGRLLIEGSGDTMVAATADGVALSNGRVVFRLPNGREQPRLMASDDRFQRLVLAFEDRVMAWPMWVTSPEDLLGRNGSFRAEMPYVVSIGLNSLIVQHVETLEFLANVGEGFHVYRGAVFSEDAREVYTLGYKYTPELRFQMHVNDVASGRLLRELVMSPTPEAVRLSPDFRYAVGVRPDAGELDLFELATGSRIAGLPEPVEGLTAITWDFERGDAFLTANRQGEIARWDAASGRETDRRKAAFEPITRFGFSPEREWRHMRVADGPLQLERQGRRVDLNIEPGKGIRALFYSPDETRLAVATTSQTLELWSLDQPVRTTILRNLTEDLFDGHFTPDGARFLGATMDKLFVWDTVTGEQVFSIPGGFVAIAPDLRHLIRATSFETEGIVRIGRREEIGDDITGFVARQVRGLHRRVIDRAALRHGHYALDAARALLDQTVGNAGSQMSIQVFRSIDPMDPRQPFLNEAITIDLRMRNAVAVNPPADFVPESLFRRYEPRPEDLEWLARERADLLRPLVAGELEHSDKELLSAPRGDAGLAMDHALLVESLVPILRIWGDERGADLISRRAELMREAMRFRLPLGAQFDTREAYAAAAVEHIRSAAPFEGLAQQYRDSFPPRAELSTDALLRPLFSDLLDRVESARIGFPNAETARRTLLAEFDAAVRFAESQRTAALGS